MIADNDGWEWEGQPREVTATAQRSAAEAFDAAVAYARKSETHLWVALMTFRLNDETVRAFLSNDPANQPILDGENAAGPPMVGCYICETLADPRLLTRKCKGAPA